MINNEQEQNRLEFWTKCFNPEHYKTHPKFWETIKVLDEIELNKFAKEAKEGNGLDVGVIEFANTLDDFTATIEIETLNDEGTKVVIPTYKTSRGVISGTAFIIPDVTDIKFNTSMVMIKEGLEGLDVGNVTIDTDPDKYGISLEELEWELDKHLAEINSVNYRTLELKTLREKEERVKQDIYDNVVIKAFFKITDEIRYRSRLSDIGEFEVSGLYDRLISDFQMRYGYEGVYLEEEFYNALFIRSKLSEKNILLNSLFGVGRTLVLSLYEEIANEKVRQYFLRSTEENNDQED